MARLGDQVRAASRALADAGVASPSHDARELAAFVLGEPRYPVLEPDALPEGFDAEFADVVARRAAREPLQHIVGYTVFRHVTLTVDPAVFVPRPETEVVAGVAIDEALLLTGAGRAALVVDLCSGSGAIAASLDVEAPDATVVAVDASQDAVRMTRSNRATVGAIGGRTELGDVGDSSLLADLNGTIDIVVSNPPYIPPGAIPRDPEVREHDPQLALFGGGEDGLEIPRAVIAAAARLLRPGGLFVMEHADVQGESAREAAEATGVFTAIETRQDLTGKDRMLVARRR
ncbi:peptide chain release factor N(5)-glutamine methyltransferase [Demequina sp. TTPB684]|uniref:peptide chain release factor N(5)-glutamine methyltransferase n=1 Tax=unclassified Demequina TaxID=2620311 RepID=UPI001CF4ACB0|nr:MULTISPECIES: peptide chain release factor N(5)-glutamine methyltransferase [unclassified Demequina]MCB2412074.1 peptide chain release factor N(5)-glutamine methyltransferase [Demequina sp. TTPB684]UPU88635.1 peptide chain release factor N(5)-glutamine methyltransferase [Demequina sp. TMPB413]